MTEALRLTVYDLPLDGQPVDLPPGATRFFYVRDGHAYVANVALQDDDGLFAADGVTLAGSGMVWVYELAPRSQPFLGAPLVLSHNLAPEPGRLMLRADRIEFPQDGITPRHGHRGPGIRRLLYGCLMGEIGDSLARITQSQAWFESGKDPVIGANIHPGHSAFVRVMVLPAALAGGATSFIPTDVAEAAKPRAVTNRLFGEVMLDAGPS